MSEPMSSRKWAKRASEAMDQSDESALEALLKEPPESIPKGVGKDVLEFSARRSNLRMTRACLDLKFSASNEILAAMANSLEDTQNGQKTRDWKSCVEELTQRRGLDINHCALWGYSAFHHAIREASSCAPGAALALLELGASPVKLTHDEESPLELAICYDHLELLERLLARGAQLKKGQSTLAMATGYISPSIVAWALANREDPAQRAQDPRDGREENTVSLPHLAIISERLFFGVDPDRKQRASGISMMLKTAIEARELARCVKKPKPAPKPRKKIPTL